MQALGGYADEALAALRAQDFALLGDIMEKNFIMRRRLYSDAVVGANNISMVTMAKEVGLTAKFTGSGGALICLRTRGTPGSWFDEEEEGVIREAFKLKGWEFVRLNVAADISNN